MDAANFEESVAHDEYFTRGIPALEMKEGTSRSLARSLHNELLRHASHAPEVSADGGLSPALINSLLASFTIGRNATPGAAARNGRGTPAYWADHSVVTGRIMLEVAKRWGGDPILYKRVGEIHDADYLMYPHDAPGCEEVHPVPLVRALHEAGVHPAICLAVLEHAPYLGYDHAPSSRLSAALSASEDIATVAALDPPFADVRKLSLDGQRLLAMAGARIKISRINKLRVETNISRYINKPLNMVTSGIEFLFSV